jgi:feruloyl esterase
MLNRTLPEGEMRSAGFSDGERNAVLAEVLKQCDAKDGSADGMIMNVRECRSFDPSPLSCRPGENGSCLKAEKLEALKLAFRGPRDATGRPIYVSIPWDSGIVYQGPGLPGYLPSGTPGPFGPASTARDIDIDERVHEIEWDAVGRLTDTAYWTNLSTYLGRGGKMMFYHGVSDPWFSAFDTWDYFQRAREANGAETWDDAARFYMVPGMMHCRGGNAFDRFDLLTPLIAWVERGEEPLGITGSRSSGAPGEVPMCPYPQYPHYRGGDPVLPQSYSCRTGS